jgi:sialidase-1
MPSRLRTRLRSVVTAVAVLLGVAALPSPAHAQSPAKAPVFDQQILFKA